MFYPIEGEFMQLLGLPPVNMRDPKLHVCELLEINYRTPVGDRWVIVENIEIDARQQNFLMLKGEATSGKVVRRIFIRMKRVPDSSDPSSLIDEWSIRFGSPLVKSPESLEVPVPRDYLIIIRRVVVGWLILAWAALVAGGIGTRGFLSQFIFTGLLIGISHISEAKGDPTYRRYAVIGLWMIILPILAMIYASVFGWQRYLT